MQKYLFFILFFISGFVHGASFDCTKAKSVTEKAICSNSDLGKLDEQLGQAYADLKSIYSEKFFKTIVQKNQIEWLKRVSKRFESEKNVSNLMSEFDSRVKLLRASKSNKFGYKVFSGKIDTEDKNINDIQKNGDVTILSNDLLFIESEEIHPSSDSNPTPKCYQRNKFYSASKRQLLKSEDLFEKNSLIQIATELFKDPDFSNKSNKASFNESVVENLSNRLEEIAIRDGVLTVNHVMSYYSECADASVSVKLINIKKYLSKYLREQLNL